MMRILIIEDEKELSNSIATYLGRGHYHCDAAFTYREGSELLAMNDYDCILLDLSLPGGDGIQLLKQLKADRKTDGVIIISARDSIDDKINGLTLGADDYLPKPFHLSELGARIAAIIRRKQFQGNNLLQFEEISVDLPAKTAMVNNKPVDLTKTEYQLLVYLLNNKNRVISKNAIAEAISGDGAALYDSFDFIYVHMKNLKKKLASAGADDYIKSIYGMGYKLTMG